MTDLIKLNDKGVRAYQASGGATHRPKQREWRNRIGKVAKYSRDRSLAYVIWDGTRTCDRVPVHLIEPAAGLSIASKTWKRSSPALHRQNK